MQARATEKIERRLATNHREDDIVWKTRQATVRLFQRHLGWLDLYHLRRQGERDRTGGRTLHHLFGQCGIDSLRGRFLYLHIGLRIADKRIELFNVLWLWPG